MSNIFVNSTNCVQVMVVLGIIAFLGLSSALFIKSTARKPLAPILIGAVALCMLFSVKNACASYIEGSQSQAWGEAFGAHCISALVGDNFPTAAGDHYSSTHTKVDVSDIFPSENI